MHALLLAAVAVWSFLVSVAGGMVGLVLGNIRLPIFILAASSPAAASGANIAVSGIAAATAASGHIRAGRVDWRLVWYLLVPSVAGAIGGGLVAGAVPGDALRIVIGAALVIFGLDTLRPRRPRPPGEPRLGAILLAGALIGFLGGLIGLILGSLRLPALLRWSGEQPARTIGTNLVVGVAVGVAGLLGHLPSGVDWTLLAVGGGAAIPGALLGARLTGRLSQAHLLHAIGAILLVAGIAAIVQGVI